MRLFVIASLLCAGATAQAEVIVEDLRAPPGEDWGPPPEPHARWVGTFGLFATGAGLGDGRLTFGRTEVERLNGVALEQGDLRGGVAGLTFGFGYRPLPWLRLPELRASVGAGPATGRWSAGPDELSKHAARMMSARLEVLAGVEHDFERVTPFARVYAGLGLTTVRVEVASEALGRIGYERARRAAPDLGVEAGLTWNFSDHLGCTFAYRYTLLGDATHGAILALAIRGAR